MVLILAESEVKDLVALQAAMAAFKRVFGQQGRGELVAWPPQHLTGGGGNLQVRTGNLVGDNRMGVRTATGYGNQAYCLLYDTGGRSLAWMGYPFSEIRLYASVGVGIDLLAKPNAARVTILGSGERALGMLEAASAVRSIQSISVYSPTVEHRTRFAVDAQRQLDIPVVAVGDPVAAVGEADVVIVITNAKSPALLGAWLPPACLVVSAGARMEVDEEVYLRAGLIATTSRDQELSGNQATDAWTLVRLTRSGRLPPGDLVELGQVVVGNVEPTDGINVFREPQGGFTDIALASLAYDRAVELGRGTEVNME